MNARTIVEKLLRASFPQASYNLLTFPTLEQDPLSTLQTLSDSPPEHYRLDNVFYLKGLLGCTLLTKTHSADLYTVCLKTDDEPLSCVLKVTALPENDLCKNMTSADLKHTSFEGSNYQRMFKCCQCWTEVLHYAETEDYLGHCNIYVETDWYCLLFMRKHYAAYLDILHFFLDSPTDILTTKSVDQVLDTLGQFLLYTLPIAKQQRQGLTLISHNDLSVSNVLFSRTSETYLFARFIYRGRQSTIRIPLHSVLLTMIDYQWAVGVHGDAVYHSTAPTACLTHGMYTSDSRVDFAQFCYSVLAEICSVFKCSTHRVSERAPLWLPIIDVLFAYCRTTEGGIIGVHRADNEYELYTQCSRDCRLSYVDAAVCMLLERYHVSDEEAPNAPLIDYDRLMSPI